MNAIENFFSHDSKNAFLYAMGPRSLLEIGRKQIIYFCAEILDEQPDPTMLQELKDEEDGGEQADEDVEMQE